MSAKQSVKKSTQPVSDGITIDTSKLSPEQKRKLDKALAPNRDKVLSLKFASASIKTWKAKAKADKVSLTEWIERTLNVEVGK